MWPGGSGGELLSIPQLIRQPEIILENDAVGIVAPVYALEMPMMVRAFMERARIRTGYFFFVYTYGAGYAAAFSHAELASRQAGLTLSYVNAVIMVDNYLPMFDMEEQLATLPEKDVDGQVRRIAAEIAARKPQPAQVTDESLKVMAQYRRTHAKAILRMDTALSYSVDKTCNNCGICAQVCPADNITVTDAGVSFGTHCEVCYACVYNCPRRSVHLPAEAGTARLRNEHVKLADIIRANR